MREAQTTYYLDHREERLAYQRAYSKANRERIKAKRDQLRSERQARILEIRGEQSTNTKWCVHGEHYVNVKHFHRHPRTADRLQRECKDCRRKLMREYQRAHPQENIQRVKQWSKSNPYYGACDKANSRARELRVPGNLTTHQIKAVFEHQRASGDGEMGPVQFRRNYFSGSEPFNKGIPACSQRIPAPTVTPLRS